MTLSIAAIIISVVGLLAISIVFAQAIICELQIDERLSGGDFDGDKVVVIPYRWKHTYPHQKARRRNRQNDRR